MALKQCCTNALNVDTTIISLPLTMLCLLSINKLFFQYI